MMKRKYVSILLAACLTATLALGACGSAETTQDTTQEEETTVSDGSGDVAAPASASGSASASGNAGGFGGMGMPPGGGGGSQPDSYDAVVEYTEDTTVEGETYTSTGTDENAIHIFNGATVHLTDITVTRTSSDSSGGDSASFYGVSAAVLATDGTAYIDGATISTDAAGGAGIFAYGDAVIYVQDATITTEQNTSGGIHAAGGGTLYGWNIVAESQGQSAAAFRSDRGGGTMIIDGGSFTSNGVGSPAIYCTAEITVNEATLVANGSEGICIEGKNSLRLFDCDLTCTMADLEQNDCTWGIILYQSMSGDSEIGCSTYMQVGGSITNKNGGLFYTTNTASHFLLDNVDITYPEENDFFLRCTGNANARGWGSTGANGADCIFTAINQVMEGDVVYDSVSNLDFYMMDGSKLTGAFLDDESCAGDGGDGVTNVYISEDSTWVVTADSVVTNLYNEGSIVDESGNTVTVVDASGKKLVEGTSSITVTVTSYSDSADFSGAVEEESFADYEVENPF